MAKKRQPSISNIARSIQEQNKAGSSRIDEVEKDVRSIENTVLVIMEVMKRKGLLSVKNEKTVTGVKSYAQEAGTNIESTAAKDILLKIYGFMTKNAEKEKKERDTQKGLRKERYDERKRKYEKLEKKLDKKKGGGFFGTVGSVLKWGFLGAIGAGLAGLVWMFKDEIMSFSKNMVDKLGDLGNSIKSVVETMSSIFTKIWSFLSENPISKMIGEKMKGFTDSGTSMFDGIIKMIGTAYDSITQWITDAFKPMADWLANPSLSFEQFLNVMKVTAGILSGGVLRKTALGAREIESAVDKGEQFRLKQMYGEDYYNKTRAVLDRYSDEELEKRFDQQFGGRFKNFFVGKLDRDELLNAIVREHRESDLWKDIGLYNNERSIERRKEVHSMIMERDKTFMDEMQVMIDELLPDDHLKIQYHSGSAGKEGGFEIVRPDGSLFLNMDKLSDVMELMRIKGKSATLNKLKETLEDVKNQITSSETYKFGKETYESVKSEYEQTTTSLKQSVTAALQHPQISISSATRTVAGVIDKGMDKASRIDYFGEMSEAYSKIQENMDKMSDHLNKGETKTKFEQMLDKFGVIGEDPSSPFNTITRNMDKFGSQIRGIVEDSKQTIITDRSGGIMEIAPFPVRDTELTDYMMESNYSSLF